MSFCERIIYVPIARQGLCGAVVFFFAFLSTAPPATASMIFQRGKALNTALLLETQATIEGASNDFNGISLTAEGEFTELACYYGSVSCHVCGPESGAGTWNSPPPSSAPISLWEFARSGLNASEESHARSPNPTRLTRHSVSDAMFMSIGPVPVLIVLTWSTIEKALDIPSGFPLELLRPPKH